MYDRAIDIYQYTETRNEYMESTDSLTLLVNGLRCSVNHRGGREGFYARQVVATGQIVFKMRYYPGIDETMFIAYDGRMYNIRHIEPVGRLHELHITAEMHDNMKIPVTA